MSCSRCVLLLICCCSFIIISGGIIDLIVWLAGRGDRPLVCSIEDFYVPYLNVTDNSTSARNNHTLYFDLSIKNGYGDMSYDDVEVIFFYDINSTPTPIGNHTFPKFNQGFGKIDRLKALVVTYGVPWEAAYANVSKGSTVSFRVGIDTSAKSTYCDNYHFCSNDTYAVVQGANIDVDGSGWKVDKQAIRLQSAAPQHTGRPVFLGIPVICFTFLLLYV